MILVNVKNITMKLPLLLHKIYVVNVIIIVWIVPLMIQPTVLVIKCYLIILNKILINIFLYLACRTTDNRDHTDTVGNCPCSEGYWDNSVAVCVGMSKF